MASWLLHQVERIRLPTYGYDMQAVYGDHHPAQA